MHSFNLLFATRSLIHCFTLVAAHTINIHNYDSKKQLHCPYILFFFIKALFLHASLQASVKPACSHPNTVEFWGNESFLLLLFCFLPPRLAYSPISEAAGRAHVSLEAFRTPAHRGLFLFLLRGEAGSGNVRPPEVSNNTIQARAQSVSKP